jgi:hypothetical protein
MLYAINPTHQQHRLQIEHVVFGDDAEHTEPVISPVHRTSQFSRVSWTSISASYNIRFSSTGEDTGGV